MRIGYARVSTVDQDTALQLSALRAARCDRIEQEKRSAVKYRPVLDKLLEDLRSGDELVVYKLDRLARSLQHLLQIIERITTVGASLRSLTEPISMDTAAGRMMIQVLGAVAEFERSLIRERAIAGMVEALKAGRRLGRPPILDGIEQNELIQLLDAGLPARDVADAYGISASRASQLRSEAMGRRMRHFGVAHQLLFSDKLTAS